MGIVNRGRVRGDRVYKFVDLEQQRKAEYVELEAERRVDALLAEKGYRLMRDEHGYIKKNAQGEPIGIEEIPPAPILVKAAEPTVIDATPGETQTIRVGETELRLVINLPAPNVTVQPPVVNVAPQPAPVVRIPRPIVKVVEPSEPAKTKKEITLSWDGDEVRTIAIDDVPVDPRSLNEKVQEKLDQSNGVIDPNDFKNL